jgi:NADP-reducing hydrogenase subunit HndA
LSHFQHNNYKLAEKMSTIKVELKKSDVEKLKDICRTFKNDAGELINVLHKAQHTFGYLPAEVQEVVAEELNVPVAKVYGVVTFYSFFTMIPKGQHPISVCTGTACYVRGAEKVLEEFKRILKVQVGNTTPDGKFSLSCLRCVGACGLAPVVMIGEKVYGRVSPDGVKDILNEYQ